MSYFASDDKPAQSYYGNQDTPSNDYNASTVDYSQRYGNTGNTTAQSTYGQQYESTNVGNTNYLTNQPGQQAQGQTQPQQQPLYGQQQYGNQTATYPAQTPQQYQPQGQNFNVAGQNQNTPTAGTLQETAGNYNGGGFYNPNANVGSYQPNQTSESPKVPTYGATGT
ncbi:MAG: hypothetical protein CMJ55_05675, partial [Planctomycetaceae bacterium]|nr:hypothetical protein [Planctomycetaceae bacterium]